MGNLWRVIPFVVLLAGCASKGYVERRIDPVACKVDVIESKIGAVETKSASDEQRINALENRLATIEGQIRQAQLANKAMLDEATAKAADSAQRAESAATVAAQSADRAQKIFELGQKK